MIESARKNELIDEVLKVTAMLRDNTKPMTNEEKVFYLEALLRGCKEAQQRFQSYVERGIL